MMEGIRAMALRTLDRITIVGMISGILLLVQPWWQGGFRIGFFTTLGFTVLQIVTSHVLQASGRRTRGLDSSSAQLPRAEADPK